MAKSKELLETIPDIWERKINWKFRYIGTKLSCYRYRSFNLINQIIKHSITCEAQTWNIFRSKKYGWSKNSRKSFQTLS